MTTTSHKANRLSKLSPEQLGDLVVDEVLKSNLKHLVRLNPDPVIRDAANRRLQTFRRRKAPAA